MKRSTSPLNYQGRLQKQKQRPRSPAVPSHPGMIQRFLCVTNSIRDKKPVDLGISPPGTLRLLTSSFGDSSDYIHSVLWSHDRTLTEWKALIKEWEDAASGCRIFGMTPPPIAEIFYKSQRMRWIVRKWIRRVRLRILDKRVADTTDLFTTVPIPAEFCITVYDYRTRSSYKFHTNTIQRMLLNSLMYSSYAIAEPQHPKNPYNNLPWTFEQSISIIQQLSRTLSHTGRYLPMYIYRWIQCDCNIRTFTTTWYRTLQIEAASSFFKNPSTGEPYVMFCEVIEDLYMSHPEVTAGGVKAYIMSRKIPEDFMKEWDALVLSQWIYENHHIFYGKYRSIDDLDESFRNLHIRTQRWWVSTRRRIVPRPTTETNSTSSIPFMTLPTGPVIPPIVASTAPPLIPSNLLTFPSTTPSLATLSFLMDLPILFYGLPQIPQEAPQVPEAPSPPSGGSAGDRTPSDPLPREP